MILFSIQGFSQTEIVDIAQITLKVGAGKTEELYYGFAKANEDVGNIEESFKNFEIANKIIRDLISNIVLSKRVGVNKLYLSLNRVI